MGPETDIMGQFLGPETNRICQFLGTESESMSERCSKSQEFFLGTEYKTCERPGLLLQVISITLSKEISL